MYNKVQQCKDTYLFLNTVFGVAYVAYFCSQHNNDNDDHYDDSNNNNNNNNTNNNFVIIQYSQNRERKEKVAMKCLKILVFCL